MVCLAAGCSFVFCLGLFLRRKQVIKTPAFLLYAVLTLGLVFTATAGYNYYTGYAVDRGVILPEKVSVTAGLSDLSTELFVLHAGSRVEIEKQQKNFYRIRFGDKIGWVKQKAVGLI